MWERSKGDSTTFLRFCFSFSLEHNFFFVYLTYSPKCMSTNFFTLSLKIFKYWLIFAIRNIRLKTGTNFYQVKVIAIMKNYDQPVKINHNLNWTYISDHRYRTVIIVGSGSGKSNKLLNFIKNQRPDIDKTNLYVKDLLESKYQLLINLREKTDIKKNKKSKHIVFKRIFNFRISGFIVSGFRVA